jgi:hypothetical protein
MRPGSVLDGDEKLRPHRVRSPDRLVSRESLYRISLFIISSDNVDVSDTKQRSVNTGLWYNLETTDLKFS